MSIGGGACSQAMLLKLRRLENLVGFENRLMNALKGLVKGKLIDEFRNMMFDLFKHFRWSVEAVDLLAVELKIFQSASVKRLGFAGLIV